MKSILTTMIVTALVTLLAASCVFEEYVVHRQTKTLEALLRGESSALLESVEEYDQGWQTVLTNPEALRYLENRMQSGDKTDRFERSFGHSFVTYTWRLRLLEARVWMQRCTGSIAVLISISVATSSLAKVGIQESRSSLNRRYQDRLIVYRPDEWSRWLGDV